MTSLAEEANNALIRLIHHAQYSAFFVHRELSHHHSDYLSTGSMDALDRSLECLWTLMQLYSAVNAMRLWWNRMHFEMQVFVEYSSFEADIERMQPILDQLFLRLRQQYDRLTNWIDHVADFSDDDMSQQLYGHEVRVFHRMEDVYEQFKDVFELLKDAGEDVAYEQALALINAVILYNSGATREQFRNALLIASRPSMRPTIPVPLNEGYFPRRCRRVMGIVRARLEAFIAETRIVIQVQAAIAETGIADEGGTDELQAEAAIAETEIADEGGTDEIQAEAAIAETGTAEEVQAASEVDLYCYEKLSSSDEDEQGNNPNNDHEQGNNPNNDGEQGNNVEDHDDDGYGAERPWSS